MSRMETGTVLDFSYTGAVQEITLPKGTYKLECWGAQGGDANASYAFGGHGGFASGVLNLLRETKLFVYVGQSGPVPASVGISEPAFNGGGYGNTSSTTSTYRVASGGGASDIRIGTDSLFARVIVAGAGGGSAYATTSQHCNGGIGGGETGGDGKPYSTSYARQGYGGTQTEGGKNGSNTSDNYGSFGQGGNDVTASQAGAGGGGGWYGGGASDGYYCGAGGGSGFVWTGLNAPDGYLLTEEHFLTETQNIAGDTAFAAPDGTEETGHSGDGYVRITALEVILEPETPGNFHVESETDQSVSFSWNASEYATGYRLRRNGSLLVDTTETSASVAVDAFASVVFTLCAYNEHGESGGASLAYMKRPDDPVLYLVTDRSAADVYAENAKGTYTAIDLNRVGAAMEYVADRLKAQGYDPHISHKTDWKDGEWVTPETQAAYLGDLAKLRSQFAMMDTTPHVPADMDGMTYSEANDIEKILEDIDRLLTKAAQAWFYSGDLFSGEV